MSFNIHLHRFDTTHKLVEKLSQEIAINLQDAIALRGRASLLVSGGSTPKPFFEKLRTIDIDWSKVTISLVDERWVPSTHNDSNERLVMDTLMQERAQKAHFVPMFKTGLDIHSATTEYCNEHVKKELLPLDVVVLGMGNDAHTASLFPNNPKLEEGLSMENENYCITIIPSTAPHPRLSLTRRAILNAEKLYVHFEGKEKQKVFYQAMQSDHFMTLPIASILHQDLKDVEVYYK